MISSNEIQIIMYHKVSGHLFHTILHSILYFFSNISPSFMFLISQLSPNLSSLPHRLLPPFGGFWEDLFITKKGDVSPFHEPENSLMITLFLPSVVETIAGTSLHWLPCHLHLRYPRYLNRDKGWERVG